MTVSEDHLTPDSSDAPQPDPVMKPDTLPAEDSPPARRGRKKVISLIVVILVIASLLLGLMQLSANSSRGGPTDPRNTSGQGTSALAELLRQEGIRITVVDSSEAPTVEPGSTVVLSGGFISTAGVKEIVRQRPERVVVMGYSPRQLRRAGIYVTTGTTGSLAVEESHCNHPAAEGIGNVTFSSVTGYVLDKSETSSDVTHCYGSSLTGYGFVEYVVDGVPISLVAGGWDNSSLSSLSDGVTRGNAAWGMRVLGRNKNLIWWMPQRTAPTTAREPRTEIPLIPPNISIAAGIAVVLLGAVAVWRGRRFGPVLEEPLPVVVQASETVEGRGRLYHSIHAYDTAGLHLRQGTITRLSRRFGTTDPERLITIVADTTSVSATVAHQALVGELPHTEDELIVLKQTLSWIEQEARS